MEGHRSLLQLIDPVAFSLGAMDVRWYALMYIGAFLVVWGVLRWRFQKGEISGFSFEQASDVLVWGFLGALIGGRLGYAFFYNPSLMADPLWIFWPFDSYGVYRGIAGMSFHGALVGAFFSVYCVSGKMRVDVLRFFDGIVPALPLGLFLGRIGNFLNGELFGRETTLPWGMDFGDGVSRHPSQLYEAVLEGILLFIVLWLFRNRFEKPGMLSAIFLVGYGTLRFFVEFVRAPDLQLGFVLFDWMSMGQILSVGMILVGGVLWRWKGDKRE